MLYYEGRGVKQDYAEAIRWWMCAEGRSVDAQRWLAVAHTRFTAEAEKGDAKAQVALGAIYWNTPQNTPEAARLVSFQEAERWYRMAAEQGAVNGEEGLGNIYWHRASHAEDRIRMQSARPSLLPLPRGTLPPGVIKDFAEAAKWFRKAAGRGRAAAQLSLGAIYRGREGVPQDDAEALKWFRRAANQGDWIAQSNLGHCYEEGRGAPQDFVEACKWYNLAASQFGVHDDRDRLAEKMTLEQISEAQRRSARFAARQESSDSATDQGRGVALAEPQAPQSSGSGFFVTEDGYLVTSFHVVEGAAHLMIRTEEGTLPAKLVNADNVNDVAVLKVIGKFAALPIAPSRPTKLGETVFTIGFPNPELQGFAPKVTKGEISSLTGAHDDPREFQISVAVQPGNSGGPLVNHYGNVVGIVEARLADIATLKSTGSLPQNVNYALKSSALSMLLESLPEAAPKLKEPYPAKDRKFEDVVKETEGATALVLVY